MQYKVTKQYLRGGVSACAEFNDLNDAKLFIRSKLADDTALNVKVVYRIEEYGETIIEFQPGSESTDESSTQGKGSSATFRPSPLSTTPRPAGMPNNWRNNDDKEDKK